MIRSCGMSHVGLVRTNNEDSFSADADSGLFVVADGMGGAQAGEKASKIAVQAMIEEVQRAGGSRSGETLLAGIRKANERVRAAAEDNSDYAGMGTTLISALTHLPKIYLANVGDSRAYLRTGGELYCITTDHSWVNEVGRGLGLSEEQLSSHPYRNVLTKAVGADEELEGELQEIEFLPGDLLLLCSDGLHHVAGEEPLAEILDRPCSLEEKCKALINAALQKGAPDNVTVILIENVPD